MIGRLDPTRLRPTFLPKFERHGIELADDLFGTPSTAVYGADGVPAAELEADWAERGAYR